MDAHLTQTYLETIQHCIKRIAELEIQLENLKADMKAMGVKLQERIDSLEKEVDELKDELRSRGRVYIREMHGTVEGDAYQRKNS